MMTILRPLAVASALLGAVGLEGCSLGLQQPVEGTVVSTGLPFGVGSQVPNVAFLDPRGKLHRLASVYEDATIIAFVKDGTQPPDPRLTSEAALERGRVAVVEVCGGPCRAHQDLTWARGDKARHLISLCDSSGIMAKRYGVTEPGAVFVVDRYGTIVAKGALGDLPKLRKVANETAYDAEMEREALFDYRTY